MPKTNTCPFTQNINPQAPVSFVAADAQTVKTVFTAGVDDSVIKAILITSTASVPQDIQFYISPDGTTNFELRRVSVPANAGNSGTIAPFDALTTPALPLDENGNGVLRLRRNFQLRANAFTALSGSEKINIIVLGEDF